MPKDPFKPIGDSVKPFSNNPRTATNRRNVHTKTGLALSDHRDDAAFRTNKSRALQKLRKSKTWKTLKPEQQQEEEERVIAELKSVREQKKIQHMMEWEAIENTQTEAIAGCVSLDKLKGEIAMETLDADIVLEDEDSGSWSSISSHDSEVRKAEFQEIRKQSFVGWNEKLEQWKVKLGVPDEIWTELENVSSKRGKE